MDRAPRRSVKAAIFEGSIGVVTASELLAVADVHWQDWRNRLTDGQRGDPNGYVARCLWCKGKLYIQAYGSGPGFRHYDHEANNCPWHDKKSLSPDVLKALQYGGQQESHAHFQLCELIEKLVKADLRCKVCNRNEYRKPSNADHGRFPDVYAEIDSLTPIAIELQLSRTFQTEISDRTIFYNGEKIALIWVFYGYKPDLETLPQSMLDVVQRQRNNAFVLDQQAIQTSHERKTLVLKCYLKNEIGQFDQGVLVTLDDLTYPKRDSPYFKDRLIDPLIKTFENYRAIWALHLEEWDHYEISPFMQVELRKLSDENLEVGSLNDELSVVRLIAAAISIVSNARGVTRNLASGHPNIKAMLNTHLGTGNPPCLAKYAVLLEILIRATSEAQLINGKVGEHLKRARINPIVSQCNEEDAEWRIMQRIVPEIFDGKVHALLKSHNAFPMWMKEE